MEDRSTADVDEKNGKLITIILQCFSAVQDGWRELDATSRRLSKVASNWRGLCPAVDCGRLMMMMMMILLTLYPRRGSRGMPDIPSRRPRFTKIT
jgi:uncharacterized protein YfbU (UPF0304 family)